MLVEYEASILAVSKVTRLLQEFLQIYLDNNKTYRVDDIKWDKNPTHTFKCTEKGQEVEKSFTEYYQKVCSHLLVWLLNYATLSNSLCIKITHV